MSFNVEKLKRYDLCRSFPEDIYLKYTSPYYNYLSRVISNKIKYLGVIALKLIKKYVLDIDSLAKYLDDPECIRIIRGFNNNVDFSVVSIWISDQDRLNIRKLGFLDIDQLGKEESSLPYLHKFQYYPGKSAFHYNELGIPDQVASIIGSVDLDQRALKIPDEEWSELMGVFWEYIKCLFDKEVMEIRCKEELSNLELITNYENNNLYKFYIELGENAIFDYMNLMGRDPAELFDTPGYKTADDRKREYIKCFDEPSGILDNPRAINSFSDEMRNKLDKFYKF